MKKYLIILLTILAFFKGYSQQRLEVKKMGFSIDVPKNWMSMENEAILKNLNNYEFTEKQLIELMRADNSSINLASYSKYDTKTYQGIIPTIKIRAIKDQTNNIKDFLILVQNSNETAKKAFDNFKFVEQPVIVHISNQQVVKVLVQFSIKNDGVAYKIRHLSL